MAIWHYYDNNGQKLGPISGRQLIQLVKDGVVTPDTIVESEEGKTVPARKITGLTFPVEQPVSPPSISNSSFASTNVAPSPFTEPVPVPSYVPPNYEESDYGRTSKRPTRHSLNISEYKNIIRYFTAAGCLNSAFVMKDNDYDRAVMDKLNSLALKSRAIEKIGLDIDQLKEIPPVFLHGYSFESIEVRTDSNLPIKAATAALSTFVPQLKMFLGAHSNIAQQGMAETYLKFGTDGRLRTSKYDATWLFFSSTQIYMYKYTIDMASDSMKETIREYFYKDITNFSTQFTSVVPPPVNYGCLTGCLGGTPKVRENYVFLIVVPGDEFACSIGGVPDAERSVNAMKQLMREKKS